ncbi:hypothetical protein CNMCM8927_002688 [Aspergillus lentulus]|uniref:Uncharacterized protein n=1 Tax=Aspergillus lentulus TaxID=293939 RepID=A0AAN5YSZ6_ASPLE|nr:hypothetical protein CNMCM8927_002688 [Aspergillus lentulus]
MSQPPQGNPLEISHRTWPKFQITIISKDATPFPSFRAIPSKKDTPTKFCCLIFGVMQEFKAAAKSPHPAGRLAKVKLLPSNAESKPKAPIEPNKELPDGVKNILSQMGDKNGAQVADVEELSKKLGKLAATSMNFATVAGSEKASDPGT